MLTDLYFVFRSRSHRRSLAVGGAPFGLLPFLIHHRLLSLANRLTLQTPYLFHSDGLQHQLHCTRYISVHSYSLDDWKEQIPVETTMRPGGSGGAGGRGGVLWIVLMVPMKLGDVLSIAFLCKFIDEKYGYRQTNGPRYERTDGHTHNKRCFDASKNSNTQRLTEQAKTWDLWA